jgi:hypothetical protein
MHMLHLNAAPECTVNSGWSSQYLPCPNPSLAAALMPGYGLLRCPVPPPTTAGRAGSAGEARPRHLHLPPWAAGPGGCCSGRGEDDVWHLVLHQGEEALGGPGAV